MFTDQYLFPKARGISFQVFWEYPLIWIALGKYLGKIYIAATGRWLAFRGWWNFNWFAKFSPQKQNETTRQTLPNLFFLYNYCPLLLRKINRFFCHAGDHLYKVFSIVRALFLYWNRNTDVLSLSFKLFAITYPTGVVKHLFSLQSLWDWFTFLARFTHYLCEIDLLSL